MNFGSCNFGLKSYLWFQIELALRAHSISKSHVWFQTKLHSTQFNYHYKSCDFFPANSFNFKPTFVKTTLNIHRMYKSKIKILSLKFVTDDFIYSLFQLEENLSYFIDLSIMKLLYTWHEEFWNRVVNYYIVYPHAFSVSFFGEYVLILM